MGVFPFYFGAGRGVTSRRRPARAAFSLLVALLLGAAGNAWPIPGISPAFAKGPNTLAELADAVSDAVVNISATQMMSEKRAGAMPQLEPGTPFDDLSTFRRESSTLLFTGMIGPD